MSARHNNLRPALFRDSNQATRAIPRFDVNGYFTQYIQLIRARMALAEKQMNIKPPFNLTRNLLFLWSDRCRVSETWIIAVTDAVGPEVPDDTVCAQFQADDRWLGDFHRRVCASSHGNVRNVGGTK
jgi:hypothetical protein